MRLLFVALTKHQYRYFKKLKSELKAHSSILFLPTLNLSIVGFVQSFSQNTNKIQSYKYKEVDAKYKGRVKKVLYKLFLKAQIPFIYSSIYRAIKKEDPDFVIFWNGKKFHQAIGVEVAKKFSKKMVFFENGFLPHTTQMDFKGVNASNSVPKDISFYKNLHLDKSCMLSKKLEKRVSKKQKFIEENEIPKRYIFVPFQVAYDTQIIQHSPWISDMYDLFDLVVEMANKTKIEFVIKEHPSDRVSSYEKLHQNLPSNIHFSQLNTQDLIEKSDAILTINSSVGMEGLLFSKRVIVLGEAFYAIDEIVKIAHDKHKLLEILMNLEDWKVDEALIEKFLKYLQCDYLIPNSWREPTKKHFEEIEKRLKKELENV